MSATLTQREKMYRAYCEFFDTAERKRRWNPFNDIPWEKIDPALNTEDDAICLETFCGVELYVPDYTSNAFNLTRNLFGAAWFEANWGYEESKHALTYREYLVRSGLRTEEQYNAFEDKIFGKIWKLPFKTRRQMNCYGALQESATYLIYATQRDKARRNGNEVLEKIYFLISRDEAAHRGFYQKILQFELQEDHEGALADLAHVAFNFQMPGVGLIPEYDDRLKVLGVGISPQYFLQNGIFPLLRALGISRTDLIRAYRRSQAEQAARPADDNAPNGAAEMALAGD
ncbi:MAG TPA: acyl-ACP desaturase [Blastocatellia bacterium]|nr:acyl-ACP desaturase [Blastocatellia bacterium]